MAVSKSRQIEWRITQHLMMIKKSVVIVEKCLCVLFSRKGKLQNFIANTIPSIFLKSKHKGRKQNINGSCASVSRLWILVFLHFSIFSNFLK